MNCIVVVEKSWGIGYKGDLLTYLPGDLKHFKEKTKGKTVVMGRKTLFTFPNQKPLPKRNNIILTTDNNFQCKGATIYYSIEELMNELKEYSQDDIFVIGGESVYKQMLKYCDTAYVTKIHQFFRADTFFPNLDKAKEWKLIEESEEQQYRDIKYTFCEYTRNK
ncbi:MAG: dihydrofolate reductase [Eubacteriales bacterium]